MCLKSSTKVCLNSFICCLSEHAFLPSVAGAVGGLCHSVFAVCRHIYCQQESLDQKKNRTFFKHWEVVQVNLSLLPALTHHLRFHYVGLHRSSFAFYGRNCLPCPKFPTIQCFQHTFFRYCSLNLNYLSPSGCPPSPNWTNIAPCWMLNSLLDVY